MNNFEGERKFVVVLKCVADDDDLLLFLLAIKTP
jgi:hypothetical protein